MITLLCYGEKKLSKSIYEQGFQYSPYPHGKYVLTRVCLCGERWMGGYVFQSEGVEKQHHSLKWQYLTFFAKTALRLTQIVQTLAFALINFW